MKREIAEKLALSERHAQMIEDLLRDHIPDRPVWAFGSRTFGRARRYSDLDLAIGGTASMSASLEYDLEEAFDQSLLPIEVDLVDLNDVSDTFRARIEPYFVPVQEPVIDRV
jgi:predicted nucleotidyltransferase